MRGLALAALGLAVSAAPGTAQDASPSQSAAPPSVVDGTGAAALEAAIPTTIAGLELETVSFSGDDIVSGADADDPVAELESLAAAAGASISDLALASGSGADGEVFVGILGAWLGGVPAADFSSALTPLLLESDEDTEVSSETIAGREVLRIGPGSGLTGDDVVYVLESGDTAWYVTANDELLAEVISALP